MKKNLRRILVLALAIVLLCSLTACGERSSPQKTVEGFFKAVKSGELDKAVTYFTPSLQKQYQAILSLSNALFGIDAGPLLEGLVAFASDAAISDYSFKVTQTERSGDRATVTVVISLNGSAQQTTEISCVKMDREWYIEK